MQNKKWYIVAASLIFTLCVLTCQAQPAASSQVDNYIQEHPEYLKKVVTENPDIVLDVIAKNPQQVIDILEKAMNSKMEAIREAKLSEAMKNRLAPSFVDTRPLKPGSVDDADIEIAVYSSFQCSFCKKGDEIISELMEKYPGRMKVVFKHSTHDKLSFKEALIFETLGQKNPAKAWEMYAFMFENMEDIRNEPTLLDDHLKYMGFDVQEFYREVNDPTVIANIRSDSEEVREFGLRGTPNFIINGVLVQGALPIKDIIDVIEKTTRHAQADLSSGDPTASKEIPKVEVIHARHNS